MTLTPDPVWPVVVLALIQVVDAVMCLKPVAFIADCLTRVRLPRPWWRVLPVVKFAAAAGLIAGIWLPALGLAASIGLVVYFLLAVGSHLRVRDLGRDLLLNTLGMLGICVAVLVFCFAV